MYDFKSVLEIAKKYEKDDNYLLAAYYFWEIEFAYQDEELPHHYTSEIGSEAFTGFQHIMDRHEREVIEAIREKSVLKELVWNERKIDKFKEYIINYLSNPYSFKT